MRRMFQKYRLDIVFLLFTISSCVGSGLSQTGLTPFELTGPQSPTRDPQAVRVIQTAIGAMGGQTAWASVTKVHSAWTVADPNSPGNASTETWDDDWSAGFMVFNHQITDTAGAHILSADSNHNVQDQEPSGTTPLPRKLQDIALPWCLPAAALQFELNNPAFKIEYLGLKNSTALVRITRISNYGLADFYSIQVWQIDLTTGFPAGLRFFTEDLTHHLPYPQSLRYSSYQPSGGLQIPNVLLFNQNGHPSALTLTSLSF